MSCLTNSILQLKGGVQMEQEKWLEQTEDELFDLGMADSSAHPNHAAYFRGGVEVGHPTETGRSIDD